MSEIEAYETALGRVTCLTDGRFGFDAEVFPLVPAEDVVARLAAVGETELRTEFNAFLLALEGQPLTLVDTGCGALFGDAGGDLARLLAELKVAPSDIKRVIFTHMHRDHFGGSMRDGAPVFDQAEIVLSAIERDHCWGGESDAAMTLAAYEGQIRTVVDGEEIAPGITAWALPGHTPGHMGLRIGAELVLIGDVLHSELLQLKQPEIYIKYDDTPDAAVRSRFEAFVQIADHGLVFSGMHQVGAGKFARLEREGSGFRKVIL